MLFHEAKTGKTHQLNSVGTLVSGLPPFRPLRWDRVALFSPAANTLLPVFLVIAGDRRSLPAVRYAALANTVRPGSKLG